MTISIDIDIQDYSSITQPISNLNIDKFTVFAGENNAGKTSLMNAIKSHKDIIKIFGKDHILHIASDAINPKNIVVKTSATSKDNEFTNLLKPIIDQVLKEPETIESFDKFAQQFNGSKNKLALMGYVNDYFKKIGIKNKEFDIKIDMGDFTEELVIKNILKTIIKDLHYSNSSNGYVEVDINNIGSGTKRLIITALLQYYKNIDNAKKFIIFFEEPEAYLHPKAKKNLFDTLVALSKQDNIYIVITTHDPYFIQLSKDQTIYHVSRNPIIGNTKVEKVLMYKILNYDSYAEVNYQVFEMPSEAYFLELYDHLKVKNKCKEYWEFDAKILFPYFSKIGDTQSCTDDSQSKRPILPITRLRHNIAHGRNDIFPIDIKAAIDKLIAFNRDNP